MTTTREAFGRVRERAASTDDGPVVMLNINRYTDEAGFPDGPPYVEYLSDLELAVTAGQTFLDLPKADRADRMFAGRATCVANATILSLPADRPPLQPSS